MLFIQLWITKNKSKVSLLDSVSTKGVKEIVVTLMFIFFNIITKFLCKSEK